MRLLSIITLSFLLNLSLLGCSLFKPYQPDIQQGNVIEASQVDKLSLGMSFEQVEKIMKGPPLLQNVFDNDQLSYVYTLVSGRVKTKIVTKRLILIFNHGKLAKIDKLDR